MQTRVPLACAFVALSTLTAGCPSTNDSPDAAKPSGQVSAAAPTDDTEEAVKHFGEIAYYVCDLGSHDSHSGVKGNHLEIGDEVRLVRSGSTLKLKLGNKQIDVAPSPGGKELKGDSDFQHDPVATGPSQQLKHQVAVVKSTCYTAPEAPAPACDPYRDIIDIEFCPEKGGGGWDCKSVAENGEHQGDVHAQPR